MASSGGGSALKWRPLVAVVQNGGGVSCRVFLQRNGNSSRRPPVCRLRGGKAGFHRVLQQSFLINKTPRPRGIIFTPVKTSVFAVTSTNGDLIHRDFIGLSLGKKIKGGYLTCFSSPKEKKKFCQLDFGCCLVCLARLCSLVEFCLKKYVKLSVFGCKRREKQTSLMHTFPVCRARS